MRQRDDFGPHSWERARPGMQGPVGPFDRLFETPRGEMSDSDINDVASIEIWIDRAQAARPFEGCDRRLRLVAHRMDNPFARPGESRVWVASKGAIESRHRHRR